MKPIMAKTISFTGLLLAVTTIACSLATSPLPTLVPTAAIPTNTPAPTATYEAHQTINELARRVVGTRLNSLSVETYTEYKGQVYPDGRKGYDVDITLTSPDARTRTEILQLAFDLAHEFYYNFVDTKPMYLTLHLRAGEEDSGISGCVFGLGIGYQAVASYLPQNRPSDLETWFRSLVRSQYYGDLPGETEALLSYGNDPASSPGCTRSDWKE